MGDIDDEALLDQGRHRFTTEVGQARPAEAMQRSTEFIVEEVLQTDHAISRIPQGGNIRDIPFQRVCAFGRQQARQGIRIGLPCGQNSIKIGP